VGFDNEVMGDARLYRVSNNAFGLALKMERTTIFFLMFGARRVSQTHLVHSKRGSESAFLRRDPRELTDRRNSCLRSVRRG
jgi:hypothetical protein